MIGFIIALVLLLALVSAVWYMTMPPRLPPGPRGLPIFGSMFQTMYARTLPKLLTHWAQKYGPLYKFYVGNRLTVVLADRDLIEEALVKQADAYSDRPPLHTLFPREFADAGITNSSGSAHTCHRGFGQSLLHGMVADKKGMEPRVKEAANRLIEHISDKSGKAFDPALLINDATCSVITSFVFGRQFQFEDPRYNEILQTIHSRLTQTKASFLNPPILSEFVAKMVAYTPYAAYLHFSNKKLIDFIRDEIKTTRQNFPPNSEQAPTNFVQMFTQVQHDRKGDAEPFSDRHLMVAVANFLVGGTQNIGTMINWSIFCMAHNPEIQKKVYDEIRQVSHNGRTLLNYEDREKMPFTEATLNEILRFGNLLPMSLIHQTRKPTTLRGYEIPQGTVVVPLLTASLHDPKVYPNPERFDPNRFLNITKDDTTPEMKYLIPFSLGERRCLGEPLAQMELFLFFTALISRFQFTFPSNEKPPFDGFTSVIRAPASYQVIAEPRMAYPQF